MNYSKFNYSFGIWPSGFFKGFGFLLLVLAVSDGELLSGTEAPVV